MKKTMIALVALSGVAFAETTIWDNTNLCIGSDSVLTTDVSADIATAITTSGNTTYSIFLGQNGAGEANKNLTLTTTDDIYLNTFGTNGFNRTAITSITLNLQNGGINTNGQFTFDDQSAKDVTINFGQDGYIKSNHTVNFVNNAGFQYTLTADVDVAALTEEGLDRDLFTSSTTQKMWNSERVFFDNRITLSVDSLDAAKYTNLGNLVYANEEYRNSAGELVTLTENSYALVFDGVATNTGTAKIHMIVTTPEPATATLSLLALAGLAARRRH